jgi:hypothetical protein
MTSFQNILYNSAGSPSVPGDLPFLNFLIAETHSSFEL